MKERSKYVDNPTKKWFSVVVPAAHARGGDTTATHTNYVYAKDAIDALGKVRKMRGWKRSNSKRSFPEIMELTLDEARILEERIRETPRVSVSQAKRFGFYGDRKS